MSSIQPGQEGKGLLARQMFEPSDLQITGKSVKQTANVHWLEGEKNCTSYWNFTELSGQNTSDQIEIEANMFVESKNSRKKKIPVNVIINNPDTGKSQTETLTVSNNKPALLQLGGNILEGSTTVTISMAPKHLGDFIGIKPDSVRLFHGKKSFEYNFLKGLTVISAQFVLMVVIATLGSTFFSLPVNILFCLFIFFCGNITDFMRDISTVINLSAAHDHNHDHGMSAVVKTPVRWQFS